MRKLFMAIFIPILVLAGTPAILAVIMYDGAGYEEMPNHLYTEDADAVKMLYQELSDSLDELESGVNDDMEYNVHEDIINVAIYQQLKEINPNYAPSDDCATSEECYVRTAELPIQEGSELRLVGAWVEFEQNKFIMNVFIDVQITESIAYKTVIETHFKLEDHPGQGKYTLQFEKINIGNLPIPSGLISTILNAVESNFEGFELDGLEDLPFGEFDIDSFTFTIEKQEIVEMIGETEDGVEPTDETLMLQEIASIIFEQGLVDFEIVDEELILAARISKFASEDVTEIPEYLYELHEITGYDELNEPIYGEFDETSFNPETHLQDVITEFVINNALLGGGFEINEELFNKIIYHGAEGFNAASTIETLELPDGTTREVEVGLQAVWFTIEEDAIYANALFKLDSTMSLMKLKATKVEEASSATELVFDFTELSFGADEDETAADYVSVTNLEVFESFLVGLEDVEFGGIQEDPNGGVFLTISSDALSGVLEEGSEEGTIAINGISLVHGALVLDVGASSPELQAALDDLQEAVNSVLEDEELITNLNNALNPDNDNEEAQDVIDAVTNIQETLLDENEELDAEDVELLFEEIQDLPQEDQEAFIEEIGNLLPEDVLNNFAGYFGDDVIPTSDDVPTP